MRILKSFWFAELIWVVAFPVFMLVSFSVNSLIYPAFLEWFPDIIPNYNFVTEHEEYIGLYTTLSFISGIIVLFSIAYISVRFDNERMEYMITETEGMYTLRDGAMIYYPRYFKDDVIISLILPLPLVLLDVFLMPAISFLPDGILSLIENIFLTTRAFTDSMDLIFAYFVMSAVCFISRIISGIRAIDVFRASWLSDIEYVG